MKLNGAKKAWGKMTAAELAEATREFDYPLPPSRYKPLTKAQRERFERARRAGRIHAREIVTFDIDPKLANEAVKYAKKKKMTVSQVVERGLRRELAVND